MSIDLDLSGQTGPAHFTFTWSFNLGSVQLTYDYLGGGSSISDVGRVIGTNDGDVIRLNSGLGGSFHVLGFSGGAGYDDLTTDGRAGNFDLTGVTGVESYHIGSGACIMPDSVFTNVAPSISNPAEREIYVELFRSSLVNSVRLDASTVSTGHNINLFMGYPLGATLGAGNDIISGYDIFSAFSGIEMIHGGAGIDTLYHTMGSNTYNGLLAGGPVPIGTVDGVEIYRFNDNAVDKYYFQDSNFVGITGNVIIASLGAMGGALSGSTLSASNALWLYGSVAQDALSGGAADDTFGFSTATLRSTDTVDGGAGHDQLLLTGAGAFSVAGVSGVEYYQLSSAGSVVLTDANFASVAGTLGVRLLAGGTVDASAVTAGHALMLIGSGAGDDLVGSAGDDVFSLLSGFGGGTSIAGGAGHDALLFQGGSSGSLAGISGVEFYDLSQGTANSVTIADTNVAGLAAFGMQAGNGGDRFDLAGLTDFGVMHYLFGGTGNDIFVGSGGVDVMVSGGGNDSFTGGAGGDAFALSVTGTTTIADFVSGTDQLVFSDALFDLGASEGAAAAFDRLDPSAFSAASDGSFTTTAQRFSYDSATHELIYAEHGSASLAGEFHTIATLTSGASVIANDLFFTH